MKIDWQRQLLVFPQIREIALKTQQVLMACIESSKKDGALVEL
jgi:hypothetical protein